MLITYIRSSSYNNYAYCQMQYFITYVLGHQPTSGKKADLGTIVHKVMETLARLKKDSQENAKKRNLIIDDDAIGKIEIKKQNLLSQETVDNILNQSFDFYSNRSSHNFDKADFKVCNQLILDTLNYNDGQFDPRKRNIVAAEPQFDIAIEEDWARYNYTLPNGRTIEGQLAIKGTIDLVTESAPGVIEVVDWKTGRRLDWATGEEKTYGKLCNDPQLLLYNYAISKLFPDYDQSIMSIFFIKDGGPFSMCFDRDEHDKFLEMLRIRFEEIKQNNTPKPISQNRENWKCTKLCHYYKNNWPGTDKNMCIYIEDHIKKHGIDKTVENCSRDGFSIDFYSAPG